MLTSFRTPMLTWNGFGPDGKKYTGCRVFMDGEHLYLKWPYKNWPVKLSRVVRYNMTVHWFDILIRNDMFTKPLISAHSPINSGWVFSRDGGYGFFRWHTFFCSDIFFLWNYFFRHFKVLEGYFFCICQRP